MQKDGEGHRISMSVTMLMRTCAGKEGALRTVILVFLWTRHSHKYTYRTSALHVPPAMPASSRNFNFYPNGMASPLQSICPAIASSLLPDHIKAIHNIALVSSTATTTNNKHHQQSSQPHRHRIPRYLIPNALHPTLNNSLNASSYNAMATHHLRPSRPDASRK